MTPHIIHDYTGVTAYANETVLRKQRLTYELASQGITECLMFPAINDESVVFKNINKAHKQIVQYAKDNNLPEVLIFEDDIKFTHPNSFNYYLQNKPEDFDIYFGGLYLGEITDNIVQVFTGMHCYIVHERFYDTFLNTTPDLHIDAALAHLGRYVVCNPFAAIQHNGFSYNESKYCNYDVIINRRELYKG